MHAVIVQCQFLFRECGTFLFIAQQKEKFSTYIKLMYEIGKQQ
jgi:hypothetical protein